MTESTARADRYDLQTSASPFYTWEVPQKPIIVKIPYALIDQIEKEAVENFRSLSSRGSEIGGLLVGSATPGNPSTLSLTDYELISCDYSRGPLYRLSEADVARFERAIEQRLARGHEIAGFFRSQTRKGMSLSEDDLAFFEQRFGDPHQIVLLVRPFATKVSTGAIFFREGDAVNGEQSLLEFPFRSSELGPAKAFLDLTDSAPKPAPPVAAPAPPKPTVRAQIVPIASRREPALIADTAAPAPPQVSLVVAAAAASPVAVPAVTLAKPAPLAAPATTAGPAPLVDGPAVEEKPAENDEQAKNDEAATPTAALKSTVAEEPADAALTAVVPQVETSPLSHKMVKWLLAAAASLAMFVVLFIYPGLVRNNGKRTPAAAVDSSPLQLRVERTTGDLLLTWNRDSDAIRNAKKAVLSISDGEQHENVEMDLAQLRNGSIVYSPSGTDISFKMEVMGRGQTKLASESVRVLRTRPSPMQDQAAPPGEKAPAAGKPVGARASATRGESRPVLQAGPLKPFRPDSISQRLRPLNTADLPDAPTLAGVGVAPTAVLGVNLSGGVQAPAAPQMPAPPPPAAPATTQQSAPAVAKSGGQIQQATLIYKRDPEYPKIAKQTGAKGQVKLIATIGTDGKVKAVKVVSGHPMLQNAALDAVRQWIYKPTLLNGAPVETETEILVNFLGER